MAYSFAQKKAYWAKQKRIKDNGGIDPDAKPKAPFKRLENPSCYQQVIFQEIASGTDNLVVDAVAGSGKSSTLLNGLFFLPPGSTACFCAFGKDIADEIKEKNPVPSVDVATTHSFGYRAVRRRFPKIRIDKYKLKNAAVAMLGDPYLDPKNPDEEKEELVTNVCKAVGLAKQWLASTPEAIDEVIERYGIEFASKGADADQYEAEKKKFIGIVVVLLEFCRTDTSSCDFDDMIWFPNVYNLTMDCFDIVFVDETQDLNKCQIELVKRMVKPSGRIIAVGDPRQAIFLFRGADSESMNNLVQNLNAKRLPLSFTYRCPKSVVKFVQDNLEGFEHLMTPDSAQNGKVVESTCTEMMKEVQAGDFIVSRTNAPLISIAMRLIRQGKRCNIRGRDIGGNFKAFIRTSRSKTIYEFLSYVEDWRDQQIAIFEKKMTSSKKDYLAGRIDTVRDKAECLLALASGCRTVADLVGNIDRMFADQDDQSIITLGTTHKLKGLQRNRVFMLASTFKPGKDIEESNLFYVAATRSAGELYYVVGPVRLDNDDAVHGM